MELRHLEYFVAVAEERSFTHAATRLRVVQSGVSAVVKALEQELGAALFDRRPRQVDLTDAGRAVLPKARAALDAARAAVDAISEVDGRIRGMLRIGTLTHVPPVDVAALLGDFHHRHPEVAIRLVTSPSGSAGLCTSIAEGSLDVAFVSMPSGSPAGVRLDELASGSMDVVVPPGHRLADRQTVVLADIANEQFIDFPLGYGNRAVADRAFAAAGLDREVSIEIADLTAGAGYVANGLGVALLPAVVVPSELHLVRLRVTDADLRWPLAIATSRTRRRSAAAGALLDLIPQHLRPGGPGGSRGNERAQ